MEISSEKWVGIYLFLKQRQGQTKLVGGETEKISDWGAKRYTHTFLLHFSITIVANFKEGGGNCHSLRVSYPQLAMPLSSSIICFARSDFSCFHPTCNIFQK